MPLCASWKIGPVSPRPSFTTRNSACSPRRSRRCRQVLKLRKIYGLSHREIARQLGISERTVNVQVGLGVRRCADFLRNQGVLAPLPDTEGNAP
ncbi:MAG: sigma factor-like helix-turn-helix DNA-binding protein [Opitutaceae bacterium]